jgi:hypothetical protein
VPSQLHEAILDLFRAQPKLAPDLLTKGLGLEVPSERVSVLPADFGETRPAEYRADHVVLVEDHASSLGIIVEVQLSRDERKRYFWPYYAASLRARQNCPAIVLVVCPLRRVAAWARAPIELGGENRFRAIVFGPDDIPAMVSPEEARADPELAVLSALAHGKSKDISRAVEVAQSAIAAVAELDRERSTYYYDIIWSGLGPKVQEALRVAKANYQYQSEFARKYVEEGRQEGHVAGTRRTLEKQLRLKFGALSPETEARLAAATEAELDLWTERILTAKSADAVFSES